VKKELNIAKSKILIVILAGGQSRRFGGGFKTLSKFNNKSILDRIIKNFENLEIEIALNINSNKDEFLKKKLKIINDEIKNFQGPLAGIYSTMKWVLKNKKNIEWIFTIPSDTPFLSEELFFKFINNNFNKRTKIILAESNNKVHPVIGLWHISLLENLESFFKDESRKIMDWVEKQNYELLNFKNPDYFFNVNSKADLKEAVKIENEFKLL
tara:strand:+ start:98 stop:733 length:636 start_codon:yes stop_codon:yes gene_type:complete